MRGKEASRLVVRPTVRGWQAILIGGAILTLAFLIGTTQFYQLGYAFAVIVVAAFFLGFAGSRGLRFSRSLPLEARVFAGKQSRVDLNLSGGPHLVASKVEVVDRLPEPRTFEMSLAGRSKAEAEAPIGFTRRGIYELGPAEVRTVDSFGLLRFAREFEERTEVIVYPEVHLIPDFPLRGGNMDAGARGVHGYRGEEFANLREYRIGDDRRHIHWKSVARTGELVVKEFAVQAPRRYTVALDLCRRGLRVPEREIEDAVSAAGSVLTYLADERLPARLLCADRNMSATGFGSGDAAYWEAMRVLATVKADGDRELGEVVWEGREKLGEGVVLVSRVLEEGLFENVQKLRGSGLSVVVVALASHAYRGSVPSSEREDEFLRDVGRLEAAGAQVCIVRHPEGVAGLSGARSQSRPRSRGVG